MSYDRNTIDNVAQGGSYKGADYGQIHVEKPDYAATVAITPDGNRCFIIPAVLTGAMTLNLTVTKAKVGDELILIAEASGAARTITLGTGLEGDNLVLSATTKKGIQRFFFDGVEYVQHGTFKEQN